VAMQVLVFGFMAKNLFDINYNLGAIVSTLIITTYCMLGGVRSVILTDVIQIIVVVLVLPIICYFAVHNYGGLELLWHNIADTNATTVSTHPLRYKYTILMVMFALQQFDPSELHRLIIARTEKRIKKTMVFTALISIAFHAIIVVLTLIAFSSNKDLAGGESIIYTIKTFTPPGVAIAGFVAMIAVVMSTTDSYLNTCSIILVQDVVEPLFGKFKSSVEQVYSARVTTLVIAIGAMVIALNTTKIMNLAFRFGDLLYPTIIVPAYACIFGVKTDFSVVKKSMFTGVATLVMWEYYDLANKYDLMAMVPGFLASLVSFIIFKKFTKRGPFDNFRYSLTNAERAAKSISRKSKTINTCLATSSEIKFDQNTINQLSALYVKAQAVCQHLDKAIKKTKEHNKSLPEKNNE
ncbi:MAG: hypothetical protein AAF153_02970, partial [Pseudomonadota bacterium]